MCCCGSGLGSSLIVRMNTEDVLKEMGRSDIEVTHASLSDCAPGAADLFIVGGDLEAFVEELPEKIVLKNILDKKELKEKLEVELAK